MRDRIDRFFAHPDNLGIASVTEAARLAGVPESSTRQYARDNGLRQIGKTYVYTKRDVMRLVAARAADPSVRTLKDVLAENHALHDEVFTLEQLLKQARQEGGRT